MCVYFCSQAWRGEDRLLSPARSPTRSLRAAFDTAAEDKTPVSPGPAAPPPTAAATAAPGSPPRTAQDLSAPLTNMFSSPGKQADMHGSPTKQAQGSGAAPAAPPAPHASPAQAGGVESAGEVVPTSHLRVAVPKNEHSCGSTGTYNCSLQIGSPDIEESSFAHVSSYGSNEAHAAHISDVSSNPPSLGGAEGTSPAVAKAGGQKGQLGGDGVASEGAAGAGGQQGTLSAASQAMQAQMNHMRFELAGLNRYVLLRLLTLAHKHTQAKIKGWI